MSNLVHLLGARTSVVIDVSHGVPAILHWGRPLGPSADLPAVRLATTRALPNGTLDEEAPLSFVPEHGAGFPGRPGLSGHRPGGGDWAPRFTFVDADVRPDRVTVRSADPVAGLELQVEVRLEAAGDVLSTCVTLTNRAGEPYLLERLSVTVPMPAQATELMTFTGRWCREFHPQRQPWTMGAVVNENRSGRTSHDHTPAVFAGSAAFGEEHGEVWGLQLAWSGNHEIWACHDVTGRRYVQAGELLLPGEIELAPGGSYSTPWLHGTHSSVGLNGCSQGFHAWLRSRPGHPSPAVPRKVLLNTWEAVYFDHDLPTLLALADAAADIGVERFVLDDGWFRHRRHDRAGLGDWFVDEGVWPDGLAPLVDHVRGHGMEFGIWVEPEMVNPDSDLYRAHPDWALVDHRYEPPLARHQLVLDLANPQARTYVYERLHALLSDNDIGYVKWDMNRAHVAATHDGRAGTHAQTLALYGLLDDLRASHPSVEIESCSSGGGRADAAILERTVRLWTSDCNDALERQAIQRGCSYLFPPEVMGAHIGPTHSHTTGRVHTLAFRAATAIFGHLGIEWNVLSLDARERAGLREVVALHQRLRPLLHEGTVFRMDPAGPHAHAHAVVSADRRWAVAALVQLSSAPAPVPPALRIPGLDADRRYRVERLVLPGEELGSHRRLPGWLLPGASPLVMSGNELAAVGVPLPVLHPESAAMVEITATD